MGNDYSPIEVLITSEATLTPIFEAVSKVHLRWREHNNLLLLRKHVVRCMRLRYIFALPKTNLQIYGLPSHSISFVIDVA